MKTTNRKTCFDCLHCKVSSKSTETVRYCFCAKTRDRGKHKDPYWLAKPICKKFQDMGDFYE